MKKKIIIPIIIIAALALILFLPIPRGSYDDGGTREYDALTYKLVIWNKIVDTVDENGEPMPHSTYRKTSIFWYPNNKKTIDELWKMEIGKTAQSSADTDNPIDQLPTGVEIEIESITNNSNGMDLNDVEEPFFEDDSYIYIFGNPISQYVIVKYTNGSTENVKEALEHGHIQITDLDKYNINYYAESKLVENIIDLAKSGELATADALEGFYSDDTYCYYFSSIKSQYVIVHYKDGTEQTVKDALEEGKIKISDLDSFGISYYKEPFIPSTNDWGITLEAKNVTPSGLTLVCYQSGGENVSELNTGSYFVVERLGDDGWVEVEHIPSEYEISWDLVARIIERESTTTWDINWEFLYGELPTGEYRIGKEITNFRGPGDYDKETLYAGFEIK